MQIGQNSNKSNLNFNPTGTDKVSKKQMHATESKKASRIGDTMFCWMWCEVKAKKNWLKALGIA